MKYEIVDKKPPANARSGELAKLYEDLTALMKDAPDKKLSVEFDTKLEGLNAMKNLATWADDDGLVLYSRTIRSTTKREFHLEKKTEEPA